MRWLFPLLLVGCSVAYAANKIVSIGSVNVGTEATFDSTGTTPGDIVRWSWTTVPGGSALVNGAETKYPDSGAATPIDMTDNEGLWHTSAIVSSQFLDTSGNANHLTLQPTITLGTGVIAGTGSASFDDTQAELTLTTPLPTSGVDYTIAFWFKGLHSTATWRAGAEGGSIYPILLPAGGTLLGLWNGSFQSCGFNMVHTDYSGWNHILVSATGTTTEYFVNGRLACDVTGVAITAAVESIGNWGAGAKNQVFADELSEIAVWSRKIGATEANTLYETQKGGYVESGATYAWTPDVIGVHTIEMEVTEDTAPAVPTTASITVTAAAALAAGGGGACSGFYCGASF